MRKRLPIILGISAAIITTFVLSSHNSLDEKLLSDTISVSAVYLDGNHIIKISYYDKSNSTNSVTLEVVGLSKTFQKKYQTSSFTEEVPLSNPPEYGWSTLPVTFLVEHKEFGRIQLKTEISPLGSPPARVIYGRS